MRVKISTTSEGADKRPAKKVVVTRTSAVSDSSAAQPQAIGQRLIHGVTHDICGAQELSGVLAVLPPGMATQPHIHHKSETILFIIEGWAATLIGRSLEPVFHGPGEFVFIPDGTVHVGVNLSSKHRIVVLEMRSDPHVSQDAEILHDMRDDVDRKVSDLQAQFAKGSLPLPEHWDVSKVEPFRIED
jgi:uncharacterized RmlC-like cupin family protein